jgi:hypothetical protein
LFQFFICCYIYVVSVNERFLSEIYFACATGFIIALSLYIYIGDTSLIAPEISEDFSLNFIFQKIRSSGRFFWVSYYGFILIAIYFFSKHLNIKIGSALLIIAAVIQSYDLSKIKVDFNSDTKRPYTSDSVIERYLNNKKNIQFIYCFDMHLAKEALLDNKKVNNFYMAHNLGRESAKRFHSQSVSFKKNKWDANSLYVLEDFNFLPDNKLIKAEIYNKSFLIINQNHLSNNYLQIKFDTSSLKSFYENIDKYSTIALAVRDEASNKMPKWYKDSMYLKFGSKISELKFRGSYTALIDNNKLLNEQIKNDTIASINYNSGGLKIELVSAGLNTGDYTKIKFNKFNFSLNKRGINAVAIDKNGVYHLFHWDTYENNY